MKALPKKLLPLTLFGIAFTSLFFVQPVQAYTVTLQQVGSNVVANGSGAINLTGLPINPITVSANSILIARRGDISTGPTFLSTVDIYAAVLTGSPNFGSGREVFPDTGSGDLVGISIDQALLFVPQGYVSNAALSDSMTFNNATFASLGVTPGTYVWTWGTGQANQNFTLQIGSVGVPGVPDGGSTVSLLGCALLGVAALRHKLSC
jgi:VPDSG-CTERM motif